jgi:hypothetical protein
MIGTFNPYQLDRHDVLTLSAAVLASPCPSDAVEIINAMGTKVLVDESSLLSAHPADLLSVAMLSRAVAHCGDVNAPLESADEVIRERLSKLEVAAGVYEAAPGFEPDPATSWYAVETLCVLDGEAVVDVSTARDIFNHLLLQDGGASLDKVFSLETTYGLLRLDDIAVNGCDGAWWDGIG